MGPGWAFTFLAGVYVVLIGVVFWVMRDGMKWRGEMEEKRRLRREREAEGVSAIEGER
jgi:hypothetical protein